MSPVLTSPLVSTQWLADHLGSDELAVLDASVHMVGKAADTGRGSHADPGIGTGAVVGTAWVSGRESHERGGHVPGAVFADLIDDFSEPDSSTPFTRPSAERFEHSVHALGITAESTVVIYDDGSGEWAARLWWIFRGFGFDRAAVLDGGFRKWQAESRPVRVGQMVTPRQAGSGPLFLAGEERPLWADRERVERAVSGADPAALVFAADESILEPDHPPLITGSTMVPVSNVIDITSNTFRARPALAETFTGVRGADEIVTYCGIGSVACIDALALTVLGHERVSVYDGSLADWWGAQIPA